LYYNKKKISRKEKCGRVINLYLCSLTYHKTALDNGQVSFEDFKYDVFGLVESLKRYVKNNHSMINQSTYNKLNSIKLNEYGNKAEAIKELDNLYNILSLT